MIDVFAIFIMSTFCGKMLARGFDRVCIDNFLSDNYDCTVFFLSHFHSDHMRGIYESTFHSLFEKEYIRMYCSEITRQFILNSEDIKIPPHKIRVIDRDGTDVMLDANTWIKVSWLPAGHCPGSIMFLFEGFGSRLLYTGDFRVSMEDLKQFEALHFKGEPLPLDMIYLDTTFATSLYQSFPTRHTCLQTITSYTDDWLHKNKLNRVVILSPAWIGLEFLMIQLYDIYEEPIHVCNSAFQRFLSSIDLMRPMITTDYTKAKIHFCGAGRCETCFRAVFPDDRLLLIKPSALYFTQPILKEHGHHLFDERGGILRVAYSSHSSCEELVQFVNYLNPRELHPCVIAPRSDPNEFLQDFMKLCSRDKSEDKRIVVSQSSDLEQEEDEDSCLSEMDLLCKGLIRYLARSGSLSSEDDEKSIISQLGIESPTWL